MHSNLLGSATARAILLASLILWTGSGGTAAAQDPNDITLQLSSTTGNPGDTIEVRLDLVADEVLPESMTLFIAYDPTILSPVDNAFEIVVRNPLSGEPILDNEGNTVFETTPVRLESAPRDAQKQILTVLHEAQGVVAMGIQGLNENTIGEGPLVTIAFEVAADAEEGVTTEVYGVIEGEEVLLPDDNGGVSAFSTAVVRTVAGAAVYVTYDFEDVLVPIGCVPPAAPGGITATQNLNESVELTWSAVAGDNIEYRVYRSTTNSAASAAPIGEEWRTQATFSDITALLPQTTAGEGCNAPEVTTEVHYFYWVKARSEEGCESPLSATSAEGFRTGTAARFAAMGSAFAGLLLLFVLSGMPARWSRAAAR